MNYADATLRFLLPAATTGAMKLTHASVWMSMYTFACSQSIQWSTVREKEGVSFILGSLRLAQMCCTWTTSDVRRKRLSR